MKGLGHLLELYGDLIQRGGRSTDMRNIIDNASNAVSSAQKRLYSATSRKSNMIGGADLYSNHPDVLALETQRQALLKQERSLEADLKQVKQQSFDLNKSITNTKARLFKQDQDLQKKEQQQALAQKLSNVGNAIASGSQAVGNAVVSGVQKTSAGIKSVGTLASKGAKGIGNAIASGSQAVGNAVVSGVQKTSAGIKSVGSLGVQGITSGTRKLSDGIKSIGSSLFSFGKKSSSGIKSIGSDIKKGIQTTSKDITNTIDNQRLKDLNSKIEKIENKKEKIEYKMEARSLPDTLPRRNAIPKSTTPTISRKDSKLA
jgi:predicted  nucleic acid-binding Zn-ribbon protein